MERYLLVFRQALTAEQKALVARDLMAKDLKQELDAPFGRLSDMIAFARDDIDLTSLAIYSTTASKKTSLLLMRDWAPLYQLLVTADLICSIEKFTTLIEKLSDVSSAIDHLDTQLRSYAHHINQVLSSDAGSFGELGELLQIDMISYERDRLAGLIRDQLEQHRLHG